MSNKESLNQSKFAVPGEKLGVIEEFIVGKGTYENNGIIYSSHVGYAFMNTVEKTIQVKPCSKNPIIPKEQDEVIGLVTNVQDRSAIVEIYIIQNMIIPKPFTALLHISNSSPRYERLMYDVCKRGDIIKAKVTDVNSRIPKLTTVGVKLGIIKAVCSKCGKELIQESGSLVCRSCGNKEHRKIAQEYDKLKHITGGKGDNAKKE